MSESKEKLLIVADYFYPHWTGIAKSMYYFLQGIHEYYDITLLTIKYHKDLKKREKIFSANVIRENYLFSISRAKYSFVIVIKFLLLVQRYDIIIINSPFTNILFITVIAKLFNKKIIIIHHGDLVLPGGFKNRIIEKTFDISTVLSLRLATKATSFTMDYARHSRVLKKFLYKCQELILPVFLENKRSTNDKLIVLEKLKKEKKLLLGFAGRFVEEKGFDVLLEAIKYVKEKFPDVVFTFAGEVHIAYENFYQKHHGKLEENKENLIILDLLSQADLVRFYKTLDFIILSSRSDCFPLVQAEAMLCRVPAIATDIPGLRYLVKRTGFGAISKREDPKNLAKTIIDAVGKRNAIMIKYKKVKSVLNNKKNVEKIREFIES